MNDGVDLRTSYEITNCKQERIIDKLYVTISITGRKLTDILKMLDK